MILVVSGHFLQIIEWSSPEQIKPILRTIVLLIYSFHMPLFIGLSGYLSKNLDKRRDKAFKDLLLPYFIFQIIFGVLQTSKQEILGGVIQNIFIPQFGLWYLLVLFIYRILLKDILNIKYIYVCAIVTNICTCFFEFSKEFSLYRVFGFLVFFLLGYYYSKNDNSKYKVKIINRGIAISVLVIESVIIGFLCINLSSEKYNNLLDILCHRIVYTDYDAWYLAPLFYIIALLVSFLNSWLFISIFQKPFKFSKYVGKDTLPIYISHLALYIVLTRLPISGLWKVLFAAAATVISCVLFSCSFYTKIFNAFISKIIGLIYRESLKK